MIVSGTFSRGVGFAPVVNRQGDVQTESFAIANNPAVFTYKVTSGTDKTMLVISVGDADTGRNIETLYRVRGTGEGVIGLNSSNWYSPTSQLTNLHILQGSQRSWAVPMVGARGTGDLAT
jgi:hypothetical protein